MATVISYCTCMNNPLTYIRSLPHFEHVLRNFFEDPLNKVWVFLKRGFSVSVEGSHKAQYSSFCRIAQKAHSSLPFQSHFHTPHFTFNETCQLSICPAHVSAVRHRKCASAFLSTSWPHTFTPVDRERK